MKMTYKPGLLALWLAASAALNAASLTATTAVHTKPDENSPVVSYLRAGTTPVVANTPAPAGWTAVAVSGPFEAYVLNKDINKSLDVTPGSAFRTAPKLEAPALATMQPGDKVEITGLRGKWTQVKVEKSLQGFIRGYSAPASPVAQTTPASTYRPASQPAPAPLNPAPSPAAAYAPSQSGQAAPMLNLGDGGSAALPRSFLGKFISTRRPFAPRRPYDYQINDEAGVRFAYLDLSKLMLTDALEKYLDRSVIVYGVAKNTGEKRDIVIEVESLQLK